MLEVLDRADRGMVHQLGDERHNARLQDVADGLARVRQPRERGQRGHLGRRLRDEPHGDLRHDAERALRTDEKFLEVVAADVLDGPPAEPQHVAAGHHDLQPQHVITRDAVLKTARPARVGRDIAADGALVDAGRVGRVEEAVFLHGLLQVERDDARLHHGQGVRDGDVEDAVHARHVQADTAGHGQRAARQPGRCAARHDRHARRVRDAQYRRNLRRGLRVDHDVRLLLGPCAIIGVGDQVLRRGADAVGAERVAQFSNDACVHAHILATMGSAAIAIQAGHGIRE